MELERGKGMIGEARRLQCVRWAFDGEKCVSTSDSGRRQIRSHTDLDVFNPSTGPWSFGPGTKGSGQRLAYTLAMEIFRMSAQFPKGERYSLTDQIRRSSRAVCSNVACPVQ